MAEPDYYKLIGVARDANLHEIRSKFRAKVLAEHPDKGGDPKKFQLLNKAYNVLTDAEKRKRYDSTGRAEKSPEEEFVDGFGGGRLKFEPRTKDADDKAIVSLQDRIITGAQTHEEGFAAWLRQRDQESMVLTDKDFLKSHLYNAAELSTRIHHSTPVLHVMGTPKLDVYEQPMRGPVEVEVRPRALKKTIEHDEVLVRMLAVPVDESMIYADLRKAGACLGNVGVGRVEQAGTRVEDLKAEDAVLILPKPSKFPSDRPLGTARTLVQCSEEDVFRIPAAILEELTPEQICLAPTIAQAYEVLEQYGRRLKPGDMVLLNSAHLSAAGSSLLQLCKLLKLKPLCILSLPGAPRNLVKGEHGTKSAWQDADHRATAPPTVRAQYERISELLVTMGAEEVFPDAVALLRWRDRNQRLLPKLALDGLATRDSCEQLIHCLQPGGRDAQLVVCGHGSAQPLDISPTLLAAWGGRVVGFSLSRWVHSSSANAKKMMTVMENVTKLIRANKFQVDTCLYKVGEDPIGDAFSRASDASENAQVVLIFPTLQEEHESYTQHEKAEKERKAVEKEQQERQRKETEERQKLKMEWLNLLFTDASVAAMNPEEPLRISQEIGNRSSPSLMIAFVGDDPVVDDRALKEMPQYCKDAVVVNVAWTEHPASEAFRDFDLESDEVTDGTWYQRSRATLENEDLDTLHDVELLGRSLVETLRAKLEQHKLDWNRLVLAGFGKGAGIALYAQLMRLLPRPCHSMALFSPVVLFPAFAVEKSGTLARHAGPKVKVFAIWGSGANRTTPASYRQLLPASLRKLTGELHVTADTMPEGTSQMGLADFHCFTSILPLCLPP
ncbi:unnamed protein product [Prorocentrum cordatum]|uniref:J domain-containing protein n=1 Tax=Prorocentrum cordatum TaxID=2364126 RepID=A0ABN9Q739_9DINO|nr:unnamed protein product [Polarella glacialis]